jgi:hypothetical protein
MNGSRRRARRGSTGRLALGLVLLALGALMLSDNLGLDLPIRLWNLWPLVVVGLGAIKMLWPGDAEERTSGFWILTGGLYCWISSWRLFGLHWGSAWPIFLIAIGVQIVLEGAFPQRAVGKGDDES